MTIHYRFWLSVDDVLDESDTLVVTPTPLSMTGSGNVVENSDLTIPETISNLYCGHVYALVEMDYLHEMPQVSYDNNVFATPINRVCTDG